MRRVRRVAVPIAVLMVAASCSDSTPAGLRADETPTSPSGLVVSDVATAPGSTASVARSSLQVSGEAVAYVSAATGTFPDAVSVDVWNATKNGPSQTVPVTDGGFDPIGIQAQADDELSLKLSLRDGGSTLLTVRVPARRPPAVVRTNPPKGRTDVALNVQLLAVFSEPVDSSTVNSSSLSLTQAGIPVGGRVQVAANGLSAEFLSDAPLMPRTTYTLSINAGVRDLDGDALAEVTTVVFATGEDQPGTISERLAFVSERDGNSEIYTINVDGTDLVRLTNDPANDLDPAWSPDGKRIAFMKEVESDTGFRSSDLYVMDPDGSNVVRLTNGQYAMSPAWSPDGKQIAFAGMRGGQVNIFVLQIDNPSSQRSVGYDRGNQSYPAWSRDGSKIAFTSDWRAFDFSFDLYVARADGSGITVLLADDFFSRVYYFQPSWSPDGRMLAVVQCHYAWDDCYPDSNIKIANHDGSGLRTLVQSSGFARPTWSPDGRFIAYGNRPCRTCTGTLRYVSSDGSIDRPIFSNGHSPSWRP